MIILDTDHVSILQVPDSDRRRPLLSRIDTSDDIHATSIITIEEQMRGWLATIAKEKQVRRHAKPYSELGRLFKFFSGWEIIEFDDAAIQQFEDLKSRMLRIGTMDLKIAAIALANNTLLLTANRKDFEQVPGLRFENWLD